MIDLKTQIQNATCISAETKTKILALAANLSEEKQQALLAILKDGEMKKAGIQNSHDQKVLGIFTKYSKEIDGFKRGPLRQATKEAESFDHSQDEEAAEALLKDL